MTGEWRSWQDWHWRLTFPLFNILFVPVGFYEKKSISLHQSGVYSFRNYNFGSVSVKHKSKGSHTVALLLWIFDTWQLANAPVGSILLHSIHNIFEANRPSWHDPFTARVCWHLVKNNFATLSASLGSHCSFIQPKWFDVACSSFYWVAKESTV